MQLYVQRNDLKLLCRRLPSFNHLEFYSKIKRVVSSKCNKNSAYGIGSFQIVSFILGAMFKCIVFYNAYAMH